MNQELGAQPPYQALYQAKMRRFFQLAFQQTQEGAVNFSDMLGRARLPIGGSPMLVQNLQESFARTMVALSDSNQPFSRAMTTNTYMMIRVTATGPRSLVSSTGAVRVVVIDDQPPTIVTSDPPVWGGTTLPEGPWWELTVTFSEALAGGIQVRSLDTTDPLATFRPLPGPGGAAVWNVNLACTARAPALQVRSDGVWVAFQETCGTAWTAVLRKAY